MSAKVGDSSGPIHVEVTRHDVESRHLVDAVVVGPDGVLGAFGEGEASVIPRSAAKSIQALPLVRTGAADAFGVSEVELALACSSHSGEADHVDAVARWLDRIGLDDGALECGASRPIDEDAADALIAHGTGFGAIHNCCSGKHAGFLTVCRHLGFDPAGYIRPEHPIQLLVTAACSEFTGLDLSGLAPGHDGCGIPTFSMPLVGLATGVQRLLRPDRLDGSDAATAAACARIVEANVAHPWWVSGTERAEVTYAAAATEPLLSKGGAEGVFVAALPGRGIAVALKARDGAHRAAETAMALVLETLGAVAVGTSRTDVTNHAGTVVGERRAHAS